MESSSPEEMLIARLDSIELHHGSHSADPPYTLMEVHGTPLTDDVRSGLAAYGFNEFQESSTGFTATRGEPFSIG
jgi:hypothetical protein